MTLLEKIQQQLQRLPPDKQSEVLDFITFLQERISTSPQPSRRNTLSNHPAFGAWRKRHIDALEYEQTLRAEWDRRP